MRRSLRAIALLVLPLTAWLVVTPISAQAATNLTVHVGAGLFAVPESGGAPADGMRFYAPTLQVHSGDTVTFVFDGFHTATVLPANTDADAWVTDHASGFTGDYSFLVPDPDDGGTAAEPALKANNTAVFPTVAGAPATCGADTDPCAAGSSVVNSGLPFAPDATFTVAITGAAGDVVPVLCLVHLNMRLNIEIVDTATAGTTQADIDTYQANKTTRDAKRARRLDNQLSTTYQSHRESGHRVWDAWAGYDAPGIALDAMYPARLEIRKGQRVSWHFDKLIYEDHTVTFPFEKAKRVAGQAFVPWCDPDGDGTADRTPPDLPAPPFCSTGEVEFAIPASFAYARGDGSFGGTDYENSGVLGSNVAFAGDYELRFTSRSSDKGFKYMCLIHGAFMNGRIVVV